MHLRPQTARSASVSEKWNHAMTSGGGVAVFWEQVVGWGGIPCTARQGAPSARSTSYQQKSATASHRSANSGLWAAHWGVSALPNMMASEPPTRATCAPAWWAATRPLGRAGCGGVLASGQQQGRSSPSTDCCFSETRLGVPKCPPKPVAHLIKSNTPGCLPQFAFQLTRSLKFLRADYPVGQISRPDHPAANIFFSSAYPDTDGCLARRKGRTQREPRRAQASQLRACTSSRQRASTCGTWS